MIKVYNNMAAGLGFSALISYFVVTQPALYELAVKLQWIWFGAMLAMVFLVMPKMFAMSETAARTAFFGYAAILSMSIAPMLAYYTPESVVRIFLITSISFLSLSLFGYTTKRDLTSLGTFAIIGVWGVFIAGIVNIWMKSGTVAFISSAVAVIAAMALTAYDTQKIKQIYYQMSHDTQALGRVAIMGAMSLYFDFVYMFINLLRLFGDRR